jgi:hypothetical protein
MNTRLGRIFEVMRRIATGLALAATYGILASTASASDRVAVGAPPVIVCLSPVDCGPPACIMALKSIGQRKAALHAARRNGSPSKVRKAKQRLAKARRERREACKGFVL